MEEIDRVSNNASPDIPKVPIKTYHWEDVRRSRRRGAYPWTHLTKPPFDEEVDPDEYTMDAFRRSRSTSTLGKSETQEVTDVEMIQKSEHELHTDDEHLEDKENMSDTNLQKASVSTDRDTLDVPVSAVNGNRARSEEPYKKRRLSVDSSYSRISLPKLRIMDRLKTAKSRLKVPKFSKRARSEESALQETKKQKTVTAGAPKKEKMQTIKDESPVYIHIPLKPPPGETDEYSKYECESLKQSPMGSLINVSSPDEKKRKTSLLDLLTQIKLVHDQHVARRASQTSVELTKTIKMKLDSDSDVFIEEVTEEILIEGQGESVPPTVEIEESVSTARSEFEDSMRSDKVTIEEVAEDEKKSVPDVAEDSSVDDNISQCLDKDDKGEVGPSTIKVQEKQTLSDHTPDPERLRKLEATLSKWKKAVPTQGHLELPPKETLPVRARSEEPKRKRRPSIDSSHSRKSLSKLAFMKKLKQAKEKIRLPNFPSFSKFDRKSKPRQEKAEVVQKPEEKSKRSQTAGPEKPVYIHIPLKLPPGESDEFSHLESEAVEETRPIEKTDQEVVEEAETPEPDTPDDNIQLIILTPPSDDEILDSAGPETPCETDQKFFGSLKIEDLKTLAKHAVDTVYPDVKPLETVSEVEDNPEEDPELEEQKGVLQLKHQILVDEEDGLKLSEVAIAMINEELEKEYHQQALGLKSIIKTETSPVLKKKVSFKRKSKTESGEPIYEDVKLNTPDIKAPEASVVGHSVVIPLESFQSMSVDEEKSYLDKQIMKTTSLEDDYNKWSKSNDHEYEPVNPPPEVVSIQGPPVIHDGRRSLERKVSPSPDGHHHDDGKTLSVHELEKNFEDRYFPNKPAKTEGHDDSFAHAPDMVSKTDSLKHSSKASTSSKASSRSKRRNDSLTRSFNDTIRTQAVKIKTKIQGIKRPKITLPSPPKLPTAKFKKPNFKKPNIKLPKLPDRPSINLPSFNFTRKDSKDSWRARQFSTESNVGDSKKKFFDFRTYPRMFDKSKGRDKDVSFENNEPSSTQPDFATVPRVGKVKSGSKWGDVKKETSKAPNVIRIPLHSEDSMDDPSNALFDPNANEEENVQNHEADVPPREYDKEHRDVEFIQDQPEEDDYIPENREEDTFGKELLKRWEHGEFHEGPQAGRYIEDIHNVDYTPPPEQEEQTPQEGSMDITPSKEHSSGSLSEHRQGVLEEIDSDEFFLRKKGISQEDIEVGKYLSSEIREAFRKPILPQSNSEDREYDMELSDQSEPVREPPRRKPLRKPKRKKTPHVSSEQLSFELESYTTEPEEYPKDFEVELEISPPVRPNRRKNKKLDNDDVVPFQETIPIVEHGTFIHPDYIIAIDHSDVLRHNILGSDMQYFYEHDFPHMYENECMKDFEQPKIKVYDPYDAYENFQGSPERDDRPPVPPTRRQRSSRSLSPSDRGSITGEAPFECVSLDRSPIPPTRRQRSLRSLTPSDQEDEEKRFSLDGVELNHFPVTPPRRRRNYRSASQSDQGSIGHEEQRVPVENIQDYRADHEYIIPTPEPPERPRRTRSCTRSISASQLEDDRTSRGADSLVSDAPVEVTEVACIKDVRDTSGYAVIDKSKARDPPLPPTRVPKTPPRPRRANKHKSKEDKFATVPRSTGETTPVRPLRNYSTLRGPTPTFTEDKENLNVVHLQSGEVVQKMRDRPLPAPPRPPRKSRSALRDISHERNLPTESQEDLHKFTAEETDDLQQLEDQILPYDHEETITHGSLVLQTLTDPDAVSHSTLRTDGDSTVHVIEITREPLDEPTADEEFSEIPEDFKKLKNPPEALLSSVEPPYEDSEVPAEFHDLKNPDIPEAVVTSGIPDELSKVRDPQPQVVEPVSLIQDGQEVSILRAQKLQVADLDVDKLHVNELQASKIIVSELEGVSLQVSEINSKGGNLIVSGIDLPPNLIQEMLQKLQMAAEERMASTAVQAVSSELKSEEEGDFVEKKTSIDDPLETELFDTAPPVPPRHDSKTDLLDTAEEKNDISEELLEPPTRPPRRSSQVEKVSEFMNEDEPSLDNQQNIMDLEECLIQELIDEAIATVSDTIVEDGAVNLEVGGERIEEHGEQPVDVEQIAKEEHDRISKSDEEPPPRPPDPVQSELTYIPSQPPPSFYALRSPHFKEFIDEDIPLPPRRKRHHKPPPPPVTASSSEDAVPVSRRHHRSPEPSIPQLTGQLVRLCALEGDRSIRRLITHITNNVVNNVDGKQDLHVVILLLLIFIAGLILLSEPKVTIYQSHWDFFNPPTDL
ncbi:hypothetical protein PPYR_10310 [Photinus pyralis]|uniref:Uncharacterized protein n=3 Tax=Photinus pyralis TaxID=7054 RepID=A0A5N4AG21_PHOPY|nr:titin-like isoform X1 [Photinus pyralis]KAB0796249.1 hypothetical protein PPYR_10310 [Photinus pyralis]